MAKADEAVSSIVVLAEGVPLENVSGWVIWELVIVVGFVMLTLLTIYFLLVNAHIFSRTRKKRAPTGTKTKHGLTGARKKGSKTTGRKRVTRGRAGRGGVAGTRSSRKKAYAGKRKRKSTGVSKPRKMPFLPDPGIIRSYTGKYLARQKIRANWEKTGLVGYDRNENPLNLEVYLLTRSFQWLPGKAESIVFRGKAVKPTKFLKNKSLKKAFQNAAGLISVGIVTELSDGENKEGLARARAEKMVSWLKQVMRGTRVDYLLVLDSPQNEWGTIDEEVRKVDEHRSVLWICLQKSPEAVNMEEALKDALSQAMHLPFDFDIYQSVTIDRIEEH